MRCGKSLAFVLASGLLGSVAAAAETVGVVDPHVATDKSVDCRTLDRIIGSLVKDGMTDEEKVIACQLAKKAGADFVKTCSGFAGGGATPHDISLMRRTVGPDMGVKASGGMRNYPRAVQILAAGANRIGAVSSVAIVTGQEGQGGY